MRVATRKAPYEGVRGAFCATEMSEKSKRESRKKENGGISQAGQRENHRFFSVFKSVNLVDKSDDTKT